jgi:hypothetical protein
VDVPLPLRLCVVELPVVRDELGVAELAAGSPVVDPGPLGPPPCAYAKEPQRAGAASAIVVSFMALPSDDHDPKGKAGGSTLFNVIEPAKLDEFHRNLNLPAIGFRPVHWDATLFERVHGPAGCYCIRSSGS